MAIPADSCAMQEEMETVLITSEDTVLEEIDEDQTSLTYGKTASLPGTPEPPKHQQNDEPASPESPTKARRDFGNISPISELLDDDDLDVKSIEIEAEEESECMDNGRNVTPEPGSQPNRASFPRISDGRSSPILAFSPSLIKSPSSNGNKPRIEPSSPSSGGGSGGGVGKRPRNIARMLDNISDHSSGEEEVNSVGVMMAKFTVQ